MARCPLPRRPGRVADERVPAGWAQQIPDVAGQLADPAARRLEGRGLQRATLSGASNQVASGRVIGTDPEAGTEVAGPASS